jgi:Arc/MetJ-type ribon-helix-helix transcriptional regulator
MPAIPHTSLLSYAESGRRELAARYSGHNFFAVLELTVYARKFRKRGTILAHLENAMAISLTPQTQKLIEERMKQAGYSSPDELVRIALQTLEELQGEPIEDLDASTRDALDRAFAQSERGEGEPWEKARARLAAKYFPHG